jgi:hypothetical protein
MNDIIEITDTFGVVLDPEDPQPEPGSVVLSDGIYGTAWQRFFSDGRWHPVRGGGSRSWEQMLRRRNLVLVYDAPVRESQSGAV